jgi:putative oxidoreductase
MLEKLYIGLKNFLQNFQSCALLLARIVVAYGFFEPALHKWNDITATANWFSSIGIPMPTLNAYMAATTELLGVVLLALGFLTRLISIPLMVVMVVAIATVHLTHGFSAGQNGFEIPLYYLLFLSIFMSHGAGKYSLDYLLFEKKNAS